MPCCFLLGFSPRLVPTFVVFSWVSGGDDDDGLGRGEHVVGAAEKDDQIETEREMMEAMTTDREWIVAK